MDLEEMTRQIEALEKRIEQLPNGYISKKVINGKTQYYLQWQESGKKKSKYIPESERTVLAAKIYEKKELKIQLKQLKDRLPKEKGEPTLYEWKTNVKVGEALERFVDDVKGFRKRDCFDTLQEYLYGNTSGKVFVLYGLRRTGKTTLIRQAIAEMTDKDRKRSVFIQTTHRDNLADINVDLKKLEASGYKYVFIDEVTLMEDFIEGAALFSDIFATCGMKIVLSGTDSLGFMFTEDDQLYDRCIMLHTTFIPYREFERVLGIQGIDEYIRFGGTMSISGTNYNDTSTFATEKSTNEYVDSAIARNIQHSLKCYQYEGHFRHLRDLYEKNELTSAINRVIEDINHRFTLEVLTKDFESSDLSISAKNLRKDKQNGNDILDRIDRTKFTDRLKELLEIRNKYEQTVDLKDCHRIEIKEYLELLDLVVDIPIITIPMTEEKLLRTVFTQPGMRYAEAEALVRSLLSDVAFQSLSITDREYVLHRILNEIKGRMLEDIVLLETMLSNTQKKIFKLQFSIGEFDMVVFDNQTISCEIYEVKHSDEIVEEQYKNLINEEKCEKTEFRYGKILHKYVIYRGESRTLENGIEYVNVEEYLRKIKKS